MAKPANDNQDEPNVGGRPLKFETVEALDLAIQNYFAECDPHTTKQLVETGRDTNGNMLFDARTVLTEQKPYTVSGLARALKTTRETLLDYRSGKYDEKAETPDGHTFSDSVKAAYERCHEYAESQLYGRAATGAAFSLKNNWGWEDKKAIDHTTKGKPMPLLGGTVPMVEENDEEQGT